MTPEDPGYLSDVWWYHGASISRNHKRECYTNHVIRHGRKTAEDPPGVGMEN